MKKTKKIIDISIKLRQNLEEYQSVNKSWTKSLRGACATASFILANELKKNKYEAWMIHATHKSNQYGDHMTRHLSYSLKLKEDSCLILKLKLSLLM